jgi:hypothetical protein
MECPQIKDEVSFGQRLANEAQRARDMAYILPPGKKRDALLEKARLTVPGARINGWLAGLKVAPVKAVPSGGRARSSFSRARSALRS